MKYLYLILNYGFGILSALAGIALLFTDPVPSIPFLIISMLLLPPFRKFTNEKTGMSLSIKVRTVLIVALFCIFAVLAVYSQNQKLLMEAEESGFSSVKQYTEAKKVGITDRQKYDAYKRKQEQDKKEVERANKKLEQIRLEKEEKERLIAQAKAVEEKRKAKLLEQEKANEEKRLAKKKEEECRKDLQCWGNQHTMAAARRCDGLVERLAKHSYEWTDDFFEPKFSHFRWKNIDKGIVTHIGDKIRFQNGFGAWTNYIYECDYDPINKIVTDVRAYSGRLPE